MPSRLYRGHVPPTRRDHLLTQEATVTTHAPHRLHPIRLWQLLDEPRVRTALRLLAYVLVVVAGLGAYGTPPSSLAAEWGAIFTDVWAALLIVGGVAAAIATPRGVWWVEEGEGVGAVAGEVVVRHRRGVDRGRWRQPWSRRCRCRRGPGRRRGFPRAG